MSQILESPRSVHVANPRAHIPTFRYLSSLCMIENRMLNPLQFPRPFMRVVMSILKTILSPSFTFSNKVVVKGSHPEHISSSVCESDLDIEIKMHIFETTVGPLLSKVSSCVLFDYGIHYPSFIIKRSVNTCLGTGSAIL